MTIKQWRLAACVGLVAVPLAACSVGAETGSTEARDGEVQTLAAFYPLQFVVEQVGGDRVVSSSLTPPAVEPHDLELSPAGVARLREADLVVYQSGFQPAVDEAIAQAAPRRALDVADTTGADPHFWLDPTLLAGVAAGVSEELATLDPKGAAGYGSAAQRLSEDLAALDADYSEGLAACESRTIVVSHEAFGFLADRYGLEQVGVAGLDPAAEPSPARLAEIGRIVDSEGVTTIFTERLVSPEVAETLASDLGIATAVLDPLEGLTDESSDYMTVMRDNLAVLRAALRCE